MKGLYITATLNSNQQNKSTQCNSCKTSIIWPLLDNSLVILHSTLSAASELQYMQGQANIKQIVITQMGETYGPHLFLAFSSMLKCYFKILIYNFPLSDSPILVIFILLLLSCFLISILIICSCFHFPPTTWGHSAPNKKVLPFSQSLIFKELQFQNILNYFL